MPWVELPVVDPHRPDVAAKLQLQSQRLNPRRGPEERRTKTRAALQNHPRNECEERVPQGLSFSIIESESFICLWVQPGNTLKQYVMSS